MLLHVCVVERTFLITSCVYSLSWHWGDVEDLRCIGVVWGRGIGTHDVEEGIPRARQMRTIPQIITNFTRFHENPFHIPPLTTLSTPLRPLTEHPPFRIVAAPRG